MKYVLATLLLIALVGAAAPPKQDIPPPWDYVFVTGYISTENNLQLFGGGRKQIYLRQFVPTERTGRSSLSPRTPTTRRPS